MASAFVFVSVILAVIWPVSHCTSEASPGTSELQLADIVVVVLSQSHPYHARRAQLFREHFTQQVADLPQAEQPELLFTHEKWPDMRGAWTVFPLASELAEAYGAKRWVVVCEDDSRMDLQRLVSLLQSYDEADTPFLGRPLRDTQASIIHHFAFIEDPSSFAYPDFAAGMALSLPLLQRLANKFSEGNQKQIQFSIDPKHEVAKYILDNFSERLTAVCEFCGISTTGNSPDCQCAVWQPTKFPTDCGPPIKEEELFVAVKTCSLFHEDRVPVVKKTWGKEAKLIEYYSDKEDPTVPTVDLGVPNTERGHCGKTQAILKHFANNDKLASVPWLLIADDDTIINLEALRHLLSCYSSEEPVFLGERYGYAVVSGSGYNYITGGGGMVFNRAAVTLLAEAFSCPSNDSPDDMLLGLFFTREDLEQTHSRHFHQARPDDYSDDFLSTQVPVSFHKHWNHDPYKVYARLKAAKLPLTPEDQHDEL